MLKNTIMSAAVMTALVAPASAATTYDAKGVVEMANQQMIEFMADGTLDTNEANQLLDFVAVDEVGRFALGANARRASEEDLAAYQDAFEDYLVEQLQMHLGDLQGVEFQITGSVERAEDDVVIETEAVGNSEYSDINWRVKKIDGQWKVIDVEAMGLWLAIEQRAQFDAKLGANGNDVGALAEEL
tara:strand:+ start:3138 stop:3695 length:558 start_codon:yes stop_codon:yes gene_type:complete